MTITQKQRQRYSFLTSFLPAAATALLLIARSTHELPVTSWVLLVVVLVIFVAAVAVIFKTKWDAAPADGGEDEHEDALVEARNGALSMVAIALVTVAAGLFIQHTPIEGASAGIIDTLLSLVAAFFTAAVTVYFFELPSNEHPEASREVGAPSRDTPPPRAVAWVTGLLVLAVSMGMLRRRRGQLRTAATAGFTY